jgi:hypothetical protein
MTEPAAGEATVSSPSAKGNDRRRAHHLFEGGCDAGFNIGRRAAVAHSLSVTAVRNTWFPRMRCTADLSRWRQRRLSDALNTRCRRRVRSRSTRSFPPWNERGTGSPPTAAFALICRCTRRRTPRGRAPSSADGGADGLVDELGDGVGLRDGDGVGRVDLDGGRAGPFGHEPHRVGRDGEVLKGDHRP